MSIIMASSAFPHGALTLEDLDGNSYQDTSGATTTFECKVTFRTDASVDIERLVLVDINDVEIYALPAAIADQAYIRCTQNSGDALNEGDTLNTWHSLASERTFGLRHTSSGGLDQVTANITFDISFDSGGSPIVDTATLDITAGESF